MLFMAVAASTALGKDAEVRLPVSVADLLRFARIGDPGTMSWNDRHGGTLAAWSPDRRWLAVVLRRGDPEMRANIGELLLFDRSNLLDAPRGEIVARFSATGKYQPLAMVHWLADSSALLFGAAEGGRNPQVYRLDLATRGIRQLTHLDEPLLWFDFNGRHGRLVAVTERAAKLPPDQDPDCLERGCRVTEERLHFAEHGITEGPTTITVVDLSSSTTRQFAEPESATPSTDVCRDELQGGISPNARFGLRICRIRAYAWPKWWEDYVVAPGMGRLLAQGHSGYLRQWRLIDLDNGKSVPLSEAPFPYGNLDDAALPQWLDDGRKLLLAGALEPLDRVSGAERAQRAARLSVLLVDPATRESRRIALLDKAMVRVRAVNWDATRSILTVRGTDARGAAAPALTLRRRGDTWLRLQLPVARAGAEPAVVLSLAQALDQRPKLVARDARSGRSVTILDPNAWLDRRVLGRVDALAWVSKDGRRWTGGLFYPPDYVRGKRYPLVLLTHGFDQGEFSLEGMARNFAARPVAAQGMMVLQVGENLQGATGAAEWPAVVAGYEGAIDALDAKGLIDRDRVGLVGWSRSGAWAGYMLTHSRYPIRAGYFAETSDIGWWSYLANGENAAEAESIYGAAPFGAGFATWRAMAPSFNLDRISTPMFLWSARLTSQWDWYAGLSHLQKPVEYWNLPDGTHDILKPSERLRVTQAMVDWFAFWLLDRERSRLEAWEQTSSELADQYRRWRAMRAKVAGPEKYSPPGGTVDRQADRG